MRDYKNYTILDAKGATGIGNIIDVSDFRTAIITVATDGGADADLTLKFVGSVDEIAPDFSAAQSVTNLYDFIQVVDLEDGSPINGDDGFIVATGDNYKIYEVNINALKYMTARVTARLEGEVTVKVYLVNNQ